MAEPIVIVKEMERFADSQFVVREARTRLTRFVQPVVQSATGTRTLLMAGIATSLFFFFF